MVNRCRSCGMKYLTRMWYRCRACGMTYSDLYEEDCCVQPADSNCPVCFYCNLPTHKESELQWEQRPD